MCACLEEGGFAGSWLECAGEEWVKTVVDGDGGQPGEERPVVGTQRCPGVVRLGRGSSTASMAARRSSHSPFSMRLVATFSSSAWELERPIFCKASLTAFTDREDDRSDNKKA